MTEAFKSKDIILQTQKKILGKFTNKKVVKFFIDERNANYLDNLHRLAKIYTGNKKESEKLIKNIIKISVKLGILSRNDQFDSNETKIALNFKTKFKELTMTIVSFYEIEFSYNQAYLNDNLFECKEMLKELTKRHLTDKSLLRIDNVFDFFSNPTFLDSIFVKRDSKLTEITQVLINDLKELIEYGSL